LSVEGYKHSGVINDREIFNLEPATTYYWRTRLMCGNNKGPYSEVWSFTTGSDGIKLAAPALSAPASGSHLSTRSVTLKWSTVPGAVQYLLFWKRDGDPWLFNAAWVDNTQMTFNWLSYNSTYRWWVSARNEYAIGIESETWLFTTPAGVSGDTFQNLDKGYEIKNGETRIIFEMQDNN